MSGNALKCRVSFLSDRVSGNPELDIGKINVTGPTHDACIISDEQ